MIVIFTCVIEMCGNSTFSYIAGKDTVRSYGTLKLGKNHDFSHLFKLKISRYWNIFVFSLLQNIERYKKSTGLKTFIIFPVC